MKYPDYFEISSIDGLNDFLPKGPVKKRSFRSGQKEKVFFVISFKMTNQYGRMNKEYKCVGFERDWDDKKITKLEFRKVK